MMSEYTPFKGNMRDLNNQMAAAGAKSAWCGCGCGAVIPVQVLPDDSKPGKDIDGVIHCDGPTETWAVANLDGRILYIFAKGSVDELAAMMTLFRAFESGALEQRQATERAMSN